MTTGAAADDSRRVAVVDRLSSGDTLFAPAHLDIEGVSALRGIARRSPAVRAAAPSALRHLAGMPIQRVSVAALFERIWELRDNVTAHDAAYIALAERLDCALLTCDDTPGGATGIRCAIDLIR